MTRPYLRLIAMLMVPCLVADPAFAEATVGKPALANLEMFLEQALVSRLSDFFQSALNRPAAVRVARRATKAGFWDAPSGQAPAHRGLIIGPGLVIGSLLSGALFIAAAFKLSSLARNQPREWLRYIERAGAMGSLAAAYYLMAPVTPPRILAAVALSFSAWFLFRAFTSFARSAGWGLTAEERGPQLESALVLLAAGIFSTRAAFQAMSRFMGMSYGTTLLLAVATSVGMAIIFLLLRPVSDSEEMKGRWAWGAAIALVLIFSWIFALGSDRFLFGQYGAPVLSGAVAALRPNGYSMPSRLRRAA